MEMGMGERLASPVDVPGPVVRSFHGPKRRVVPRSSAPPGDGCRKRFSLRQLSAITLSDIKNNTQLEKRSV